MVTSHTLGLIFSNESVKTGTTSSFELFVVSHMILIVWLDTYHCVTFHVS